MITSLEYLVAAYSDEFEEDDCEYNYTYSLTVGLQDIIEYLFEEKYEKKYNPLSWYLEDGAREFIKDIEDSWWRDEIDVLDMLRDLKLYDFLKDKYKHEVEQNVATEHMWFLRDAHNLDDTHSLYTWSEVL